jgi:hypothetical protein
LITTTDFGPRSSAGKPLTLIGGGQFTILLSQYGLYP